MVCSVFCSLSWPGFLLVVAVVGVAGGAVPADCSSPAANAAPGKVPTASASANAPASRERWCEDMIATQNVLVLIPSSRNEASGHRPQCGWPYAHVSCTSRSRVGTHEGAILPTSRRTRCRAAHSAATAMRPAFIALRPFQAGQSYKPAAPLAITQIETCFHGRGDASRKFSVRVVNRIREPQFSANCLRTPRSGRIRSPSIEASLDHAVRNKVTAGNKADGAVA